MVMRLFLIGGGAFIAAAWMLTVTFSPPPHQESAATLVERYREQGFVPERNALVMSASVGHEVFEVPAEDAEHAQTVPMGGMDMRSGGGQAGMSGMAMPEQVEEAHGQMPGMAMPEQAEEAHGQMPGMGMPESTEEAHGQMPGMAMDAGNAHAGGGGLRVISSNDPAAMNARKVLIEMQEWGFTPGDLKVKPGEVIRFTVRNTGNIPHEFMLMSHAGMGAVSYRLQRADWNLLEHEATYEKPIVMPKDEFSFAVRIEQPGAWMFMCMFPYHMQFGMMGTMATEGMAMDMGNMDM